MKKVEGLKKAVERALAFLRSEEDIESAQVFVSANGRLWARLNYSSHIPCNGLEEPKSTEDYGIGIQAIFNTPEGRKVGFGSEERDLSLKGVKLALKKAREGAVFDPEFSCLPRPTGEKRTLYNYHDPRVMRIQDDDLVIAGWRILDGAIDVFERADELKGVGTKLQDLGLIVGGDLTILQERMAVGSFEMPEVQSDESAMAMAYLTAMVEQKEAKGSGYAVYSKLKGLDDEAGREAARNAVGSINGVRVPSGDYTVILGPQPTAEIFQLVLQSCALSRFYAQQSPFMGKLGKQVASDFLTMTDKGNVPGLIGSKGITCEGLPTGETVLIKDGMLVGLLANWYESQRILIDPKAREKLGVDPREWQKAIVPRNGFRFARGGGRSFSALPGVSGTNVLFESSRAQDFETLVKRVEKGILVGRLWYTYPVHALRAGDFTGTLTADSYLIQNGKIVAPIKINTLRINDNLNRVLMGITGVSREMKPTILWAADELIYAPKGILVEKVHLDQIAEFMEETY
ncbi:MAG: hypothetical protein UY15_C0003G0026 [Parcubacteria group bacterium GW2011_GWA2_47_9]|nr:MAG: hypothetical protein UY15_C0003G0026 [Parcubacteria group bacterium GW2011_GWA2_47_9]